jgi:hypothetical protein
MTSTVRRLGELKSLLERTVDEMEENATLQVAAKQNGHSKKKLDL